MTIKLPPPSKWASGEVAAVVHPDDIAAVIEAMEHSGLYPVEALYAAYQDAARAAGRPAANRQAFGQRMRLSGRVRGHRSSKTRYWIRED